jgi:hypothetical protein
MGAWVMGFQDPTRGWCRVGGWHSRESVATTPPVVTDQRFSRQPAVCLRTVSHVASAQNPARAQRGGRRVHTNSRNVQCAATTPKRPAQATTTKTLHGNCVAAAPDTHSPTASTLQCVPRAYNDSACHAALRSVRSSRYPTHQIQPCIEAIRCSRIASLSHCAPGASGRGDSGAYRWRNRCNMSEIEHTYPYTAPRAACGV